MDPIGQNVAWISKAISDKCGPDMDLDECAKTVIAAAVDAGIPINELEKAIKNY